MKLLNNMVNYIKSLLKLLIWAKFQNTYTGVAYGFFHIQLLLLIKQFPIKEKIKMNLILKWSFNRMSSLEKMRIN